MIAMLDTNDELDEAQKQIGCPVERLLTPLTRYTLEDDGRMFAIDNGAFSGLNIKSFRSLLKREESRISRCRWVAVPDVVGTARRTLELFDHWRHDYQLSKWPLALVMQDGQEDLPIPWKAIEAVFIGGSTSWKMGKHTEDIIKTAKALDKWVHVGRVNTPGRFEHFEGLGADSIDGSGIARYTWMRERIWDSHNKPTLFTGPVQ